jgi:hypothetical protein
MSDQISFAKNIRPLFSSIDIAHMSGIFDLRNYDDVRKNAPQILRRLRGQDGPVMPPASADASSAPWSEDKIALFESWIDRGLQP